MTDMNSLRVLDHHCQDIDARWQYELSDPFWRIYLQEDDGAEILIDGSRWPLAPGRIQVIPAWMGGRTLCTRVVRHHWMHVLPGDPWIAGARAGEPLGPVLRRPWTIQDASLAERFRGLNGLVRSCSRSATRALAVALAVFDHLADQLPAPAQELLDAGATDDRLSPTIRYLESHLAEPHTLASLAARAGISPSRFHAVFVHRTGMTPMAWVRERRLRIAAQRLAHGSESIEEIAGIVGFSNRSNFTRAFTEFHGLSPAAFRQQAHLLPVPADPA